MKRIFTLVLFLLSIQGLAQTFPISINISLPPNPDASTVTWNSGAGMFTITATAKPVNGRLDPHVQESKILVTIKKGGSKICGTYTGNSAPAANFNTPTKVWAGNNAVSLIGQDCTLPPGEYELCVQFFGAGPAGIVPISEEKCKSFSIRGVEQQTYQSPQGISPANGAVLSETDLKKPITFRWTPVIPRPREDVTYRLRVWQLMEGQNGPQVIKSNTPDITKDVNNLTQASVIVQLRQAPPNQTFVWNVEASSGDRNASVGSNNLGTSEFLSINVQPVNDPPSIITLITPANDAVLSVNDIPKFSWNHDRQHPGPPSTYKIRIVAEDAAGNKKTFFERDVCWNEIFNILPMRLHLKKAKNIHGK